MHTRAYFRELILGSWWWMCSRYERKMRGCHRHLQNYGSKVPLQFFIEWFLYCSFDSRVSFFFKIYELWKWLWCILVERWLVMANIYFPRVVFYNKHLFQFCDGILFYRKRWVEITQGEFKTNIRILQLQLILQTENYIALEFGMAPIVIVINNDVFSIKGHDRRFNR